jgi:spermidine synthase
MILARSETGLGETILRQGTAGFELIVDGQFLISSASGPSSVELVTFGLESFTAQAGGLQVLIGGLGLGFSLKTAWSDQRVEQVTVVELEPALIDWHRQGLLPETAAIINDPRVFLINRDLIKFIENCREKYNLIALDIDNGPDWLSHQENAVYTPPVFWKG